MIGLVPGLCRREPPGAAHPWQDISPQTNLFVWSGESRMHKEWVSMMFVLIKSVSPVAILDQGRSSLAKEVCLLLNAIVLQPKDISLQLKETALQLEHTSL